MLQTSERRAEPHDRGIPHAVEVTVYDRDGNSCQVCGWTFDQRRPGDPRILELHQTRDLFAGESLTEEALQVLCSSCHNNIHAG
jgi:5-methylcytosine-specific restriction endonuclease McrA